MSRKLLLPWRKKKGQEGQGRTRRMGLKEEERAGKVMRKKVR
jgi:hypothetical protein